jgi:hypothetical protein
MKNCEAAGGSYSILYKKLRNVIQVPQYLTHIFNSCIALLYMAKLNKYVICHMPCTQADQSSSGRPQVTVA